MRFLTLVAAACLLGSPIVSHAQAAMAGMPMDGMHMIPPPDQLPAPVRMTGIGNSHIAIKASPEAQVWFDQGLTLLHDFWDYESAKAFEQAIRVDPSCAMCFWGLAQAEGFRASSHSVYGEKALEQAVLLKKHAGSTDKLYIEAAEARKNAKGDDSTAEVAILRKLVAKQPHDPEPRIFLAEALGDGYDDKGEPKGSTNEKIAILEAVLKDSPRDSAANHYWIHAMEPSNHPERAIASSALLASLAPASGHMVHMPGHIYYRTGDYASADKWFSASTATDEKYMAQQHVGPDDDWNYVHNMMYGIANLMEQGRFTEADTLSDRLAGARGQLSATLYIWSSRDATARVSRRLPVALRTADWDSVLALLDSAPLAESDRTANLRFLKAELRNFATGMRALNQDDLPVAEKASNAMDAALWRAQQDADDAKKPETAKKDATTPPSEPVDPDALSEPLRKALAIASLELRAGIELAQNKPDTAKKLYAQAAAAEKALGYHEPPYSIRPVAEVEAAALLRAKDYAGAKSAYEAALVERPNSGFELYGIARAEELGGHLPEARAAYDAFLKAWPTADASLPEVTHARAAVSGPGPTVAAR